MTANEYPPEIRTELEQLAKIAAARDSEGRLETLAGILDRWRSGKIPVTDAMEAARNFGGENAQPWSDGADPGMPVAVAITRGIIRRDEIAPEVWAAIEVLITLAEL